MHHVDNNESQAEKGKWEQYKQIMWGFEQIKEVSLQETIAVRQPTSHPPNQPSKTKENAGHMWRSKDDFFQMDSLSWMHQC